MLPNKHSPRADTGNDFSVGMDIATDVTKTLNVGWTTRSEKWFAVHLIFMRILQWQIGEICRSH